MVRLTGPALGRTVLQSGQSAEAQSMQLSSNEGWGTSGSPAARRLSLVPLQVDSKATLGLGGVAVVLLISSSRERCGHTPDQTP